ncbi:MAG: hypothetical protein WA966_11300 [Ornithinimicrobium sp.]
MDDAGLTLDLAPPSPSYGLLWPLASAPAADALGVHETFRVLGEIAGIPRNRPFIALGTLGPEGVVAYPHAAVDAVTTSTDWGDADILIPGPNGWVLRHADGNRRGSVDAGLEIGAAAELVWGEAWQDWQRRCHKAALWNLGWSTLPAAPEAGLPDTKVAQVSRIVQLVKGIRRGIALGGTPRSGKSTIARMVIAELERISQAERQRLAGPGPSARPPKQAAIWQIASVASVGHALPDRETLVEVGRHALARADRTGATRRLLVLDDLYAIGDGDIDHLLTYLCEKLDATVVAVLEYDVNSVNDWRVERHVVVTAVVGPRALMEFVNEVARLRPDVDRDAGIAAVSADPPVRDLARLIRILTGGGERAEIDVEIAGLATRQEPATLRALAILAAASLTRTPAREKDLPELASLGPAERETLRLRPLPHGNVRICDSETCRTLVKSWQSSLPENDARRTDPHLTALAGLLYPRFVRPLLERGSADLVPVLAAVRLYDNRMCGALLRSATRDQLLGPWLDDARAETVARFGLAMETALSAGMRRRTIESIEKMAANGAPLETTLDAIDVVRCLSTHLAFAAEDRFDDVTKWLADEMHRLIDERNGQVDQRYSLLSRLDRLNSPELSVQVAREASKILDRLNPESAEDYYTVARVEALQRRAARAAEQDEDRIFPLDQEKAVGALVSYRVSHTTPFEVIVGQMLLQASSEFTTFSALLEERLPLMASAVRLSTAAAVARALNHMRKMRSTQCNELLNRVGTGEYRAGFIKAVRQVMQEGAETDAASLVQAIATVNLGVAYHLLFDAGEPSEALARALIKDDPRDRDPKGVGMLLSATNQIDEVYAAGAGSFGAQLGRCLGDTWILKVLDNDPRPSVKYHLLKGIWDADLDSRLRHLNKVVQLVAADVDRSRSAWTARLALRIATDPGMGHVFLDRLRESCAEDSLLECMLAAPQEALAEFHRLGRMLFPEIPPRFATRLTGSGLLGRMTAARGVVTANNCREVARTLADAGEKGAAGRVLRELVMEVQEGANPDDMVSAWWTDQLVAARNGEEVVQILTALRELEPGAARRVVDRFSARRRGRPDGNDAEPVPVLLTRRTIFDDSASATFILGGLEEIRPGLGRAVYDELVEKSRFAAVVMSHELMLEQRPTQLWKTARAMSRTGLTRKDALSHWMDGEVKLGVIPYFRGPRALRDMIRTLALWSPREGERAAEKVAVAPLLARLTRFARHDVGPAVDLAALLWQLGEGTKSIKILKALVERDSDRLVDYLQPAEMLRLIPFLHRLEATGVADRIGTAVLERAAQDTTRHVADVLLSTGHVMHALARGGFARPSAEPRGDLFSSRRALVRPGALAWAVVSLPSSSWATDVAARTDALMYGGSEAGTYCAAEPFAALSVAATRGAAESVPLDVGAALSGMSYRQLLVLEELASRDAFLRAQLDEARPTLEALCSTPYATTNHEAWLLKQRMNEAASVFNEGA